MMEDKVLPNVSTPVRGRLKKSQIQDDSIMGTNNSSIVSKRSVERLYFPDEPHFFRYFVKRPQRRAPLINRGYWLRMKAIDNVVKQFLERPSEKQKVVINLGCGYDPLPWQCLSRYQTACVGVKFVDIDYKDLMLKKRAVVQNTPELAKILNNIQQPTGDVLLNSDQYVQLGCDLRDIPNLSKALARVISLEDSICLFTAEVSITYMEAAAADDLIKWASSLPDARFCLLEQLLPDGIEHPFARTMMAHFGKLKTPLGAVEKYCTTYAQEERFLSLGWANTSALNLWELWSSSGFISSAQRSSLDEVEPFDEWEEFALFGCHYFLLIADNTSTKSQQTREAHKQRSVPTQIFSKLTHSQNPKLQGLRRFAAALPVRINGQAKDGVGVFAGMGTKTRIASCDIYTQHEPGKNIQSRSLSLCSGPSSRMCHTITDLGETGSLLIGGRTSPDDALADCWLYHKWVNLWERIDDIPEGRYRHSTIDLGDGFALVSPGRSNSREIAYEYFLWSRLFGWRRCRNSTSQGPNASYGATCCLLDNPTNSTVKKGVLAGGITESGILQQDIWVWELAGHRSSASNFLFATIELLSVSHDELTQIQEPTISFERPNVAYDESYGFPNISRFGAVAVHKSGYTDVIGGIIKNDILSLSTEVCSISIGKTGQLSIAATPVAISSEVPRPLLIGISALRRGDDVVIMSGSAVCFSFGTFWNQGCFTLEDKDHKSQEKSRPMQKWHYVETLEGSTKMGTTSSTTPATVSAVIPRVKVQSKEDFDVIVQSGKPVIIEALDLGVCTKQWTSSYLKDKVGAHHQVIVHEAASEQMDFQSKNFRYVTKDFGEFLEQAESGAKLYLRSLSSQGPSQAPADINHDFTAIANDFKLPPELAMVLENFHSSPLRISGPVTMWLHYDVMANILCQIRGSKKLLLFPPADIQCFDFEPGASSASTKAFEELQMGKCPGTPHEATLLPGDVLFLPPLWLHTTAPASGLSVAVNVFFRNLRVGYSAGRDVYGNRDLQAYEKGRQDVAKIIKSFDGLPVDVRLFYLGRLAREFQQLAT